LQTFSLSAIASRTSSVMVVGIEVEHPDPLETIDAVQRAEQSAPALRVRSDRSRKTSCPAR
jgi:hypothetical protein